MAIVLLAPAIGAFVNGVFGKRLGKDAVRLTALAAENDDLRRRVVELEAELASRAETPAAWRREREEVRKRVQRLVEKLATLG